MFRRSEFVEEFVRRWLGSVLLKILKMLFIGQVILGESNTIELCMGIPLSLRELFCRAFSCRWLPLFSRAARQIPKALPAFAGGACIESVHEDFLDARKVV